MFPSLGQFWPLEDFTEKKLLKIMWDAAKDFGKFQLIISASCFSFHLGLWNSGRLRTPPSSAPFLLGKHSQRALICTQNALLCMIWFKVLLIILVPDKLVFSGPWQRDEVWIKPSLAAKGGFWEVIAATALGGFLVLPDNPNQEVCYLRQPLWSKLIV